MKLWKKTVAIGMSVLLSPVFLHYGTEDVKAAETQTAESAEFLLPADLSAGEIIAASKKELENLKNYKSSIACNMEVSSTDHLLTTKMNFNLNITNFIDQNKMKIDFKYQYPFYEYGNYALNSKNQNEFTAYILKENKDIYLQEYIDDKGYQKSKVNMDFILALLKHPSAYEFLNNGMEIVCNGIRIRDNQSYYVLNGSYSLSSILKQTVQREFYGSAEPDWLKSIKSEVPFELEVDVITKKPSRLSVDVSDVVWSVLEKMWKEDMDKEDLKQQFPFVLDKLSITENILFINDTPEFTVPPAVEMNEMEDYE